MPDADATLLMAPCFYAIGSIESLPSPPVRLKVLHICVLSHLSLDQRMLHSGNKLPSASTAFLDAFVLSRPKRSKCGETGQGSEIRDLHAGQTERFQRSEIGQRSEVRDLHAGQTERF